MNGIKLVGQSTRAVKSTRPSEAPGPRLIVKLPSGVTASLHRQVIACRAGVCSSGPHLDGCQTHNSMHGVLLPQLAAAQCKSAHLVVSSAGVNISVLLPVWLMYSLRTDRDGLFVGMAWLLCKRRRLPTAHVHVRRWSTVPGQLCFGETTTNNQQLQNHHAAPEQHHRVAVLADLVLKDGADDAGACTQAAGQAGRLHSGCQAGSEAQLGLLYGWRVGALPAAGSQTLLPIPVHGQPRGAVYGHPTRCCYVAGRQSAAALEPA